MPLKVDVRHSDEQQQQPQQQPKRKQEVECQLQFHFFQKYLGDENTAADEHTDRILARVFCCPRLVLLRDVGYCLYQMVVEDQGQGLDRARDRVRLQA